MDESCDDPGVAECGDSAHGCLSCLGRVCGSRSWPRVYRSFGAAGYVSGGESDRWIADSGADELAGMTKHPLGVHLSRKPDNDVAPPRTPWSPKLDTWAALGTFAGECGELDASDLPEPKGLKMSIVSSSRQRPSRLGPTAHLGGPRRRRLVEAGEEPKQDHQPSALRDAVDDPSLVVTDGDRPLIKL